MDYDLTIVMSNYNQAQYIDKAIESVLSQKVNFNYKLLITDDNSQKDNSVEILKSYENKYPQIIEVIYNKENGRYLKNIMRAMAITKTPYFCLLDADDYWTDTRFLQRAYNFLEKNPNYVIYTENVNYLYEDGSTELFVKTKYLSKRTSFNNYLNGSAIITQTTGQFYRNVLYSKGIPDMVKSAIGTKSERSFEGDYDRFVMHLIYGDAYFKNRVCGVYRILSTSGIWAKLSSAKKHLIQMQTYYDYNRYFNYEYNSFFINKMYKEFRCILEEQGKDLCTLKEKSITFNLDDNLKDLYSYLYDNKRLINFEDFNIVTDCSFQTLLKEMIKRVKNKILNK